MALNLSETVQLVHRAKHDFKAELDNEDEAVTAIIKPPKLLSTTAQHENALALNRRNENEQRKRLLAEMNAENDNEWPSWLLKLGMGILTLFEWAAASELVRGALGIKGFTSVFIGAILVVAFIALSDQMLKAEREDNPAKRRVARTSMAFFAGSIVFARMSMSGMSGAFTLWALAKPILLTMFNVLSSLAIMLVHHMHKQTVRDENVVNTTQKEFTHQERAMKSARKALAKNESQIAKYEEKLKQGRALYRLHNPIKKLKGDYGYEQQWN